jgi:hypothetical protein
MLSWPWLMRLPMSKVTRGDLAFESRAALPRRIRRRHALRRSEAAGHIPRRRPLALLLHLWCRNTLRRSRGRTVFAGAFTGVNPWRGFPLGRRAGRPSFNAPNIVVAEADDAPCFQTIDFKRSRAVYKSLYAPFVSSHFRRPHRDASISVTCLGITAESIAAFRVV